MTASAIPGRPRLVPGVPAGGIAAIVVVGAMVVLGLVSGEESGRGDDGTRFAFSFDSGDRAPRAPAPPAPPRPPEVIDHEAIRGIVAGAMRDVDVRGIQQEAMAALDEARNELAALQREIEASALRGAHAAVQPHGSNSIDQVFDAPDGVRMVNLTGDVTVTAGESGRVRLIVEEGGRALRTSVEGGVLKIVGVPGNSRVDARLEVPAESHLVLGTFSGDLSLGGGFHGELTADIQQGDISAEHLSQATVQIHSNGSVSFDRVDGKLGVSVFGNGDITASEVGSLALEIMGRSDVVVGHVRSGASLSVPGYAEMQIGEVSGPVKTAFMGAGSITIDSGRAEELQVAMLSGGEFIFNGTAVRPELFMGGSGSIIVPHVEGEARVQKVGSGEVVAGR